MNPRARNPVDVFHFRIDVNKVSVRSQRRSLQGEADRCWVAALDFALVGGTEAFGPGSLADLRAGADTRRQTLRKGGRTDCGLAGHWNSQYLWASDATWN